MKIKASKRTEKAWVKKHLNDGVCPRNISDWWRDYYKKQRSLHSMACYDALEWLADAEVYSLADAWRLCPRADWLLWIVAFMQPEEKDAKICIKFVKSIFAVAVRSKGASRKTINRLINAHFIQHTCRTFDITIESLMEDYAEHKSVNMDVAYLSRIIFDCLTLYEDIVESIEAAEVFKNQKDEVAFRKALAVNLRKRFRHNPWKIRPIRA
jgi:hypothetical protein